jgi:hypothetical protein
MHVEPPLLRSNKTLTWWDGKVKAGDYNHIKLTERQSSYIY